MTTITERLAELGEIVESGTVHDARDQLIDAVEAVLRVHEPAINWARGEYDCACGAELSAARPDCPTVQAVERALGVDCGE